MMTSSQRLIKHSTYCGEMYYVCSLPQLYNALKIQKPIRDFYCLQKCILYKKVRLAERSKAPDLSSGTRMSAWVRTPHLTNILLTFFRIKNRFVNILKVENDLKIERNWSSLSFMIIMQHLIFKSWCTQNYMLLYFLGNKYCLYLCSNIRFKNASVFMQLTKVLGRWWTFSMPFH